MNTKRAEELRLQANKCMADKKYAEALIHYTHAIKEDNRSAKLYSNRSLAFLRLQQYYYAAEDAKECIDLDQQWFKGYVRRADVYLECGLYEEALKSYHLSLHFLTIDRNTDGNNSDKHEDSINGSIKRALDQLQKQRAYDYQIPWVGAALGLVVGMALVTWDYVANYSSPYVRHPILKLFIIGVVSAIFFYLAKLQRNYHKNYKESLLKPPLDLLGGDQQHKD
ncbi:uncharacterized protein LOC128958322 [Oppia nitens]|uniref:uncharacterized protein LOC128958322 n=1 Tax=Oppia nitens TaxID=1686743 RepID=UPI0023DB1116|nr:uncharacterized protein LOC128958322 [Oppia nitens]